MNSEKTLIKLSKEGNKHAFEALVIKNQDKLMQIAKRACMEAHAKHTWDNRSYQLIELINQ